jgi:hypothetical protein
MRHHLSGLVLAMAVLSAPANVDAQGAAAARAVSGESGGTVAATRPAVAKGAAPAAPATAEPPKASGSSKTDPKAEMPSEVVLQREVFSYSGSGRRDPYKSLMTSSDLRPLLSDLRLTAVAFDPDGSNSVAILRDLYSKTQYRVRVGQQLGRLRVSAIRQKAVQFTIEEFGFSRQETLPLSSDTTKVRTP